jgi:hypothetical protein
VNGNPLSQFASGAKVVGSETIPLATGASIAYFLAKVYALFVAHWHFWELDEGIFAGVGGAIFFWLRWLNTKVVHDAYYRDQIEQAKVAKEWAAVPIPTQLLIEWAQWRAATTKELPQPSGGPSAPSTGLPLEPAAPDQSSHIGIQTERSTPSKLAVQTGSPAQQHPPAPPPQGEPRSHPGPQS